MRGRKLFFVIIPLLICVIVGIAAVSLRQRSPYLSETPILEATYTSPDGSFTFHYPAGWYVETLSGGRVDLENTAY
jgi:hypothetical protein